MNPNGTTQARWRLVEIWGDTADLRHLAGAGVTSKVSPSSTRLPVSFGVPPTFFKNAADSQYNYGIWN